LTKYLRGYHDIRIVSETRKMNKSFLIKLKGNWHYLEEEEDLVSRKELENKGFKTKDISKTHTGRNHG
jgi:hypothetical protein